MQGTWLRLLGVIALTGLLLGCSTNNLDGDGLTDEAFSNRVVDKAISLWWGEDYTFGADGFNGIDGSNSIIQTLIRLGYDVPLTTADGLQKNSFLDARNITRVFLYTAFIDSEPADIQSGKFDDLQRGDLIFFDYNFDSIFDHVVLFIGAYTGNSQKLGTGDAVDTEFAILTASDYFDEVVIEALDDPNAITTQDIIGSQIDIRALDHQSIAETFR